jgi:hypothetical protein
MPEIKITQMPELLPFDSYTLEGGTDPEDLLPIIDVSETDNTLKNKKVKISTLLENYITAEDTVIEINNAFRNLRVASIILTATPFNLTTQSLWFFLDPNGANRNVNVNMTNEGNNIYVKNKGASNTVQLNNMITNNGTNALTYVIPAGKTVQVIFDGTDHHVIVLD